MRKRGNILIALMICLGGSLPASGQSRTLSSAGGFFPVNANDLRYPLFPLPGFLKTGLTPSLYSFTRPPSAISAAKAGPDQLPAPFTALPADYYTRHCGYFCKLELATRKKLKIPLCFRLGGLEYEEHLEGEDR